MERGFVVERNGVFKVDGLFDGRFVVLEVVNDWVVVGFIGFVVDGSNLNDFFGGKFYKNLVMGFYVVEDVFVFEFD